MSDDDRRNKRMTAIREWATLALAVIGCVTGSISFVGGRAANSLVAQLQSDAKLDQAWDILGKAEGTDILAHDAFTRSRYDIEKTRRLIRDAMLIAPDNPRAHWTESSYYYAKQQYDKALASAQKAARLAPTSSIPYEKMLVVHVQLKEWNKALEAIDHSMVLEPKRGYHYANKCFVLWKLDRLDEAEENGRKAIELDPWYLKAYDNLAVVQQDNGKPEDAQKTLSERARVEARRADY